MFSRRGAASVAVAALVAVALAAALDRLGPAASADVARGGETAFAYGLQPREMVPGRGPQRWTMPQARFLLRDLPGGPAEIDVRLHGQRTPVVVAVDGVVVGTIDPGRTALVGPLSLARSGDHALELRTEGFDAADGRRLGALLDSVTVRARPHPSPSIRLVLLFAIPAVLVAVAALLAGLTRSPSPSKRPLPRRSSSGPRASSTLPTGPSWRPCSERERSAGCSSPGGASAACRGPDPGPSPHAWPRSWSRCSPRPRR